MKVLRVVVAVCCLLIMSNPSYSAGKESYTKQEFEKIRFTQQVLILDRDSSVFLHSLNLIKSGNSHELEKFMEYQLDEIIIAAWKFKKEMSPKQEKRTMDFLQEIKEYRTKYPRDKTMKVDPTKFTNFFGPFDDSYAERADKILDNIK